MTLQNRTFSTSALLKVLPKSHRVALYDGVERIENWEIIGLLKFSFLKVVVHEQFIRARPTVILPLTQCLSRAGH